MIQLSVRFWSSSAVVTSPASRGEKCTGLYRIVHKVIFGTENDSNRLQLEFLSMLDSNA